MIEELEYEAQAVKMAQGKVDYFVIDLNKGIGLDPNSMRWFE